jgi:hypothetical protein
MGDAVDHDIGILGERNWRNLGRMEGAFEEGQDSCRAVEPMMMIMMEGDEYSMTIH